MAEEEESALLSARWVWGRNTMSASYIIVPVEKLIHPDRSGNFFHYRNMWWRYVPGVGVVFALVGRDKHISPACNAQERITRRLATKYPLPGLAETDVLLIESAWVPIKHDGSHWLPKEWIAEEVG